MADTRACHNGPRCPAWNGEHAEPTHEPFCHTCLDRHQRDIRALVYDYLDLAQLHETSLSQAASEHTSGGGHESPTLLADHIEALQAEIVHAATTWETALRQAHALNHGFLLPLPAWATTRNLPLPQVKLRAGATLQRAIGIIAPRLAQLARLPEVLVRPAGVEDQPVPMHGWEAVQQLAGLHGRCRSTLGRTTRSFYIPGDCWACDARPAGDIPGPLYRFEPRHEGDPLEVQCDRCRAVRPYTDYETYQAGLIWPGHDTDNLVKIAA